jgi:hypothetical protein
MSCTHEVVQRLPAGKLWCRECGCLLQEPGAKWSRHAGLKNRKRKAHTKPLTKEGGKGKDASGSGSLKLLYKKC